MKKTQVKSEISTIAIIAILTISTMLIALPSVNAQAVIRNPVPYVNAVPNPAEINKIVVIHVGSVYPHPGGGEIAGWTGLTVEVTRPDGTLEILGPISTDLTGGTGVVYVPTQIGTYTLVTHFPEIVTDSNGYYGPAGTIMEDSYSDPLQLEVTDEPVVYYPGFDFPTEYWSRPIDGQMR
ncbi:MAG: hypothetical protein P8Y18_07285, partial [Candidatus Bathyarchaeota archaeon]